MNEPEYVWAEVTENRRFRLVSWDDLEAGDTLWYVIKRGHGAGPVPHGPFKLVDPDGLRLSNPQGVVLSFGKLRDRLQPVVEAPINEE